MLAFLVYTYEDPRLNDHDWFDMYEAAPDGLSDFDPVYDESLGVFLSQPVYHDGSVTWLAHPGADPGADQVLAVLRFNAVRTPAGTRHATKGSRCCIAGGSMAHGACLARPVFVVGATDQSHATPCKRGAHQELPLAL
jgi:hypothetical protein